MRRRRLGYPDEPLPVAGRPAVWWITLFRLSHREAGGGWERIAWPDGGPLWRQPWTLVAAFEIIRGECLAIAAEQSRQAGTRAGRGAGRP